MAKFYDYLSQKTIDILDLTDPHGDKARGRQARHEASKPKPHPLPTPPPGHGTTYITGSHKGGTPRKITTLLDIGTNVDLLSPGD